MGIELEVGGREAELSSTTLGQDTRACTDLAARWNDVFTNSYLDCDCVSACLMKNE